MSLGKVPVEWKEITREGGKIPLAERPTSPLQASTPHEPVTGPTSEEGLRAKITEASSGRRRK